MDKMEPFPSLYEGEDHLRPLDRTPSGGLKKTQRRRKSSGLGGEIRAGDTGGPAIATMDLGPQSSGLLRVSLSELVWLGPRGGAMRGLIC